MQESQIRMCKALAARLLRADVPARRGPGRLIFSYVNGMAEIDGKPRPARQFALSGIVCDWDSESKDVRNCARQVDNGRTT